MNDIGICSLCLSVSALTMQFVYHRFLDYHDPTIGKIHCVAQYSVYQYSLHCYTERSLKNLNDENNYNHRGWTNMEIGVFILCDMV